MADYKMLPEGSTILITGVNGFVASHCADQALQHGYKVRGTSRSAKKNEWVLDLFSARYDPGYFELVEVPDMQTPGAFDKAMQGCDAVIHVATVITFDRDPERVITPTVTGTKEILKCAANIPTVKRVVYTSSQGALRLHTDTPLTVSQDTWNDLAVQLATASFQHATNDHGNPGVITYCASKVLAEKACFEFIRTQKPHFTLNTVVPNFNTGPSIHPNQRSSSSSLITAAFMGDPQSLAMLKTIPPQHYIDVRDDARLHLAAAIYDDIENERIWGVAGPFNYNDLVDVFARIDPRWKSAQRDETVLRDLTTYDLSRSMEFLRRLGCSDWINLEDSLRANVASTD